MKVGSYLSSGREKLQDTCIVLYVLYVLSCVGVMSCVLSCMYCRAC